MPNGRQFKRATRSTEFGVYQRWLDDRRSRQVSVEGVQKTEPTKVQIVSGTDSILTVVKNSLAPVMGPIGEFAVVVVLVVFLLLSESASRSISSD
jgi:hypothetical protein